MFDQHLQNYQRNLCFLSLSVGYRIDTFNALPEIFMHSCDLQIGAIAYSRFVPPKKKKK